ncbi:MAG: methyltransferase domain-containing protein [Nitrososphaerales archaeon]
MSAIDLTDSCNIYCNDIVRLVLGDSWHPGGLELTTKLGHSLNLTEDDAVLDVACGIGSSGLHMAKSFGCSISGIDSSDKNIDEANKVSSGMSIPQRAEFKVGESARIPYNDDSFTAVIVECAMSGFTNPDLALGEIRRVLKPQGRLGITDLAVDGDLPPELQKGLEPFCINIEMTPSRYEELLAQNGFVDVSITDSTNSLLELLEAIKKKVFLVEILKGIGKLKLTDEDLAYWKRLLSMVKENVNSGRIRYIMLTAVNHE